MYYLFYSSLLDYKLTEEESFYLSIDILWVDKCSLVGDIF